MRKLVALALAAALLPASANAATIINGSFELGTNPGNFTQLASGDSTSITGWTVGGNSVDYIGAYFPAQNGSRSVDLSGAAAGSLSQSVATVAGQQYRVNFFLGGNFEGAPAVKNVGVSTGGAATNFTYTSTTPRFDGYAQYDYFFTATGAATNLTFASLDNTAFGAVLDNVSISSVTSVPEPATWAMMIGGFGIVGGALRRRQSKLALA